MVSNSQSYKGQELVNTPAQLDIVIPVYNEAENIRGVLAHLRDHVGSSFRVLICYDMDEDTTLPVAREFADTLNIEFVKNPARGPHSAVMAGLRASQAPAVLVFPADDVVNAPVIDRAVEKINWGADIVCASRFIEGGCMQCCPWLKDFLVRASAFSLNKLARIPTRDASNGHRMFSRRVIEGLEVESSEGFTYSIELLVKAHRLGWKIDEVPSKWFARENGASRFYVLKWLKAYLHWYFYAFATTYLRRGRETVKVRPGFIE
jgi:glycosyltransferase involved in cell wall biosynthesis